MIIMGEDDFSVPLKLCNLFIYFILFIFYLFFLFFGGGIFDSEAFSSQEVMKNTQGTHTVFAHYTPRGLLE